MRGGLDATGKMDAFEAMFPIGMPRQEVEEILAGLEGVSFYNSRDQLLDCAVRTGYITDKELYGAVAFNFCYDSDMKLKRVTPSIVQ
jgi:hypothetical protein